MMIRFLIREAFMILPAMTGISGSRRLKALSRFSRMERLPGIQPETPP
jgi:hypothetical protein